jgi:uncharacterized protein YecE (DUF72 family)
MVNKSEAKVRFSVKAHQSITHTRDATADTYQRLYESVAPLREVGMLGPVLLQFPYSFKRVPDNRRYLQGVVAQCQDLQLAIEFRHDSWDDPEVLGAFKAANLTLVSVDYPPLGGLPKSGLRVTSDIAYIRMHGRNAESWWSATSAAERHDYAYTPDELRPWVTDILEQQRELTQVYIMMQNTTKGHALKNIAMLKALFQEYGLEV